MIGAGQVFWHKSSKTKRDKTIIFGYYALQESLI